MKDWKINISLAKAIGYDPKTQIKLLAGDVFVLHKHRWLSFEYKDWNVIGPIATLLDCFPVLNYDGLWWYASESPSDSPQKAIALSAIQIIKEEGLPKWERTTT